jgi:hypothetical protein
MSGVEGAEREDYDEREAGVGKNKGIHHEGHEGSRRKMRTQMRRLYETSCPFVILLAKGPSSSGKSKDFNR